MSKDVRFSFDTENEKSSFVEYAKGRGLTISQFVKFAAYQYRERYPGIKRKTGPETPEVKDHGI